MEFSFRLQSGNSSGLLERRVNVITPRGTAQKHLNQLPMFLNFIARSALTVFTHRCEVPTYAFNFFQHIAINLLEQAAEIDGGITSVLRFFLFGVPPGECTKESVRQ